MEVLDKVSPGSVNWKQASKPPIKMPFRKVENCNQVVRIGKQLRFSLVNVAGSDIVQGNKKLILGKIASYFRSKEILLLSSLLLNFAQKKFATEFLQEIKYSLPFLLFPFYDGFYDGD